MSFFDGLRRWWRRPARGVASGRAGSRRVVHNLLFDVLESRVLPSVGSVSLTAPSFSFTTPKVVVTASDPNPIYLVAVDVAFDGDKTFASSNDQFQTILTSFVSGKPTTIDLNAFPTPYQSSYFVRARIFDSAGNTLTSSVATMIGPQSDKVALTVPATVSTTGVNNATVQVTAGVRNTVPFYSSVFLNIDMNQDGVFEPTEQLESGTLNSAGKAVISLSNLDFSHWAGGTYQVQASIVDPAGNVDVSPIRNMVVPKSSARPLPIVPNIGQVTFGPNAINPPNVQYVVSQTNSSIYLSSNELDVSAPTGSATNAQQTTQSMKFLGSNANAQGIGQDVESSTTNLLGNGLSQTGVVNFGQVTFQDVYTGINLSYTGRTGSLEYFFTVSPGANPANIAMTFPGDSLSLDGKGNLVLTLPGGATITESKPTAYEVLANGSHQAVAVNFVVNNGYVSFALGAYNPGLTLVIDPYVFAVFMTPSTLGGQDAAAGMSVDGSGNTYVYATVNGTNYAGTGYAPMGKDVAVTKFNSAGQLIYATFVGGNADDVAGAIAVDALGNVYITGTTIIPASGTNFPTTARTFSQLEFGLVAGNSTAFVTILNPAGNIYQSTILGGNSTNGTAIALDGFGNIWVAGDTSSDTSFNGPSSGGTVPNNPAFSGSPFYVGTSGTSPGGSRFLTKFAALDVTTTGYQYTDFMAGELGKDSVDSIAVDNLNRIYLTGTVQFNHAMPWGPTPAGIYSIPPAQQQSSAYLTNNPNPGNDMGFVVQLQEDAATFSAGGVVPYAVVTWGSYVGGTQTSNGTPSTEVSGIAVKTINNTSTADIYLTGTTNINNFFQQSSPGFNQTRAASLSDTDAFVLELREGPATKVPNTIQEAGTFVGTAGNNETGAGIVVDSHNNIYVDGTAPAQIASAYFNTNPVQTYPAAPVFTTNAFITEFNSNASKILMGSLIGGNASGETESPATRGNSMEVDDFGTIYIAGLSNNFNGPNGFQSVVGASKTTVLSANNSPGVFLAKIAPQVSQVIGPDQFERNDTSNIATDLTPFQSANIFGNSSYGPFPDLTTARHTSGQPVDYDWYRLIPATNSTLTVTISNISVFAAGPVPVLGTRGGLDLYVYQVINGFMYLLGKSTTMNSVFQTVAVNVTAGSYIAIQVNPYNYTQATYTLSVALA